MKIKIFDPMKKREVFAGNLEGKLFIKNVKPNHYMVKEQGYGIQEDVFPLLLKLGCEKIIIKAKTKDYETKFTDWLYEGRVRDYGHGKQRFLNKKYYV